MDTTIYRDCQRCGQDEAQSGDLCDACRKVAECDVCGEWHGSGKPLSAFAAFLHASDGPAHDTDAHCNHNR